MVQKTNPKLIGLFIISALFVFAGTFILLNKDRFFSKTLKYVLYFDSSIKGLNVGSAVMFNGVPIGKVTRISLITNLKTLEIINPVYIETNENSFVLVDPNSKDKIHPKKFTEKMIKKGLRAKLENQSFLTGQMMIGLGFYPETPINMREQKDDWHNHNVLELPTLPSTVDAFSKRLQKLPIQQTVTNLNELLGQLNKIAAMLQKDSPQIVSNVKDITTTLSSTSKKADKAFDSFAEDSRTMLGLNKMLRDFSSAAQSLKNWSDYLERHPEALIRGKGGY